MAAGQQDTGEHVQHCINAALAYMSHVSLPLAQDCPSQKLALMSSAAEATSC